jgi:hypothetical protein
MSCNEVVCSFLGVVLFAGACLDAPPPAGAPQARLVAWWDPLACIDPDRDPHRVVLELEDEGGRGYAASTPCQRGGLTLDLPLFGIYTGRIFAWTLGPEIRSELPVRLTIDQPIVYWLVETPR